jgi:hypothetical protein
LTLTRSLTSTRAKLVTYLLKRAKNQLPDHDPAGAFIQMGGAARAAQRLEETLAHPAHRAVAWACVCSGGQPQFAVWQNDQPFDGRLLAGSDFGDDAGGPLPEQPTAIGIVAGRRSAVAAFCDAAGLDEVYRRLSAAVGRSLPVPPTHVTLYTSQPGMMGIGLSIAPHVAARATPLPEADAALLRRHLPQRAA